MRSLLFLCVFLVAPLTAAAGEKVVGVNSYVRDIESWDLDPAGMKGVYWRQNHFGTFKITEGPLTGGLVECIGAGFGEAAGVRGEGICIYDTDGAGFTMTWVVRPGEPTAWKIVGGTGIWLGSSPT